MYCFHPCIAADINSNDIKQIYVLIIQFGVSLIYLSGISLPVYGIVWDKLRVNVRKCSLWCSKQKCWVRNADHFSKQRIFLPLAVSYCNNLNFQKIARRLQNCSKPKSVSFKGRSAMPIFLKIAWSVLSVSQKMVGPEWWVLNKLLVFSP